MRTCSLLQLFYSILDGNCSTFPLLLRDHILWKEKTEDRSPCSRVNVIDYWLCADARLPYDIGLHAASPTPLRVCCANRRQLAAFCCLVTDQRSQRGSRGTCSSPERNSIYKASSRRILWRPCGETWLLITTLCCRLASWANVRIDNVLGLVKKRVSTSRH